MGNHLLINQNIHNEAKLKKEIFLERIRNVKMIRNSEIIRNFIPSEPCEWEIIEELHKAINTGVFKFGISDYKIFAFEISSELYDWFKNNELQTIQKQVVNWIATVYLSRPDLHDFFDEYTYAPILIEAKRVIEKYYSPEYYSKYALISEAIVLFEAAYRGERDDQKINEYFEFQDKNSYKIECLFEERENEYKNASLNFINCLPPRFLENPIENNDVILYSDFGIRYSPNIKIKIAYFTDTDWIFIVERDLKKARDFYRSSTERGFMKLSDIDKMMKDAELDTLNRSESDKIIWEKWLYSYRNFEKTNSIIYGLFDENISQGLVYLIRQRNSNYFKIGWTEKKNGITEKQSVENRISSLQTGNPEQLDIVGFFKASGIKTEKTLHTYFDSKRKTGEWFNLTETECQNILNDDWRISKNIF